MTTLLEKALSIEKDKRVPKAHFDQEKFDLFLAFCDGRISAVQAAKALNTTGNNVRQTFSTTAIEAVRRGYLVVNHKPE